MLRAYLDASGQQSDPVIVVAGFLGWLPQFESFEKEWAEFTGEFGLDHFHATEFWARKSRPYVTWDDAKHKAAKDKICSILSRKNMPPMGVSVGVSISAFHEWRETLDHYYPSDAYYFCLDRVLHTLIYSTGPKYDGITIYCDQEKQHERLGADIARWHEARLAKRPELATNPLPSPQPVDVHYGSKRRFIPLQLADILANDAFRIGSKYLETGVIADPYFTECLRRSNCTLINYLYSENSHFELDHGLRHKKSER